MPNKTVEKKSRTVREMLRNSANLYPRRTAIEVKIGDRYKGYTYSRLYGDAKKLGSALYARLGRGARVMIIGENGYEYVLSYLSVTCFVGAAVPMPVSASKETVCDAAELCEISAVIYSEAAKEAAEALESVEKIPFSKLASIVRNSEEAARLPAPQPASPAELAYTYGSEEIPRAAVLTHKNICFSINQMEKTLPMTAEDKFYSILPTAYSYERICGTLYPLSVGATVTYGEGLYHLSTNLRKVRPTAMLCIPLVLDRIYGKIWANIEKKGIGEKVRRAIRLTEAAGPLRTAVRRSVFAEIHDSLGGRLSVLICGGGTPSYESVHGLREFGIRALATYGCTESAALMCVNRRDLHEYTSVGMPVPDGLVDVYNMQQDGVGEIRYKGANLTSGYYRNAELTEAAIRDGWFYTGDMGYFDRRGFLHTVGKKSNMIVLAKRRAVFPEELEAKLCESPFVSDAVVVGSENARRADYDIVAVIEPNTENMNAIYGNNLTHRDVEREILNVVEGVHAALEPYKRIARTVIAKEALEKNELGKILRSKVRVD